MILDLWLSWTLHSVETRNRRKVPENREDTSILHWGPDTHRFFAAYSPGLCF